MFLKVICVLSAAIVAVSTHYAHSSQRIDRHDGHHHEVVTHDKHGHHHVDYYAHPKYKFEYKVDDDHTGDHKQQNEHRDGHDTESNYSWHVKHISPKKHNDDKKEHKKDTKKHIQVKHHQHGEEISKDHHEQHEHQQEKSKHRVLVDYYAYPKYEYGYKVNDPHTGDNKEQHEHRDGHNTKSDYSLHLKHVVPKKHH